MVCNKCGSEMPDSLFFCTKCGNKLDKNISQENIINNQINLVAPVLSQQSVVLSEGKPGEETKKSNLKLLIILAGFLIGLVIFILLIVIIVGLIKPKRSETLMTLEKDSYLKFVIDDKKYYLGDKVSVITKDNLIYDENFSVGDIVYSDSISTRTFYDKDNETQFLAALYCSSSDDCVHNDSVLVKANFYEDSDVIVNDFIKFGMTYADIVKHYGKEDGRFYQDQELLVWTFGKKHKVGDPYYVLRFDEGGFLSSGGINEIRIGVWWYEGEYEHVVIQGESEGEK